MGILRMFEASCNSFANKKVLVSPSMSFTMLEIKAYSDYIANELDKSSKKNVVPIYISDDIYVLPIVLGILKVGKIPLPLTTSLDIHRSLSRVSEVEFDVVIHDISGVMLNLTDITIIEVTEKGIALQASFVHERKTKNELEHAYIICTSGTTGIPKKVFITEDNLIWLLDEFYSLVDFTNESSFLFSTPYTFDVSLTEIFAPVFKGGVLYCLDKKISGMKNLRNIPTILKKNGITHMSASPSYAELLYETEGLDGFADIQFLCLAGELFPISLAKNIFPLMTKGCRIFNLYGPSEATVYATWYELDGHEQTNVPIGIPLKGADVLVLNEREESSESGELLISGKGVTSGYLLDSDLTYDRFRFIDGVRYYVTGDYVYIDGENNLVFKGRQDEQVQINGIRVELSEINSIIASVKGIESSKASYKDRKLYIFYKGMPGLKAEISRVLPNYLKPIVIRVDEFKLNTNRKLDVQAMIDAFYLGDHAQIQLTYANTEQRIQAMLKKYKVTDMSDLDSLDIIRFIVDIEDEFNISIPDNIISEIRDTMKLITFLMNHNQHISPLDSPLPLQPCFAKSENDSLNVKILMSKNFSEVNLEERTIDTLYYQKSLDLKAVKPVLLVDLNMSHVDLAQILKIKSLIIKLSEKVDVLRFILFKDVSLFFRKIKLENFEPIVYVCDGFLPTEIVADILYEEYGKLLFLVLISKNEKKARFYFSHHIMDKASLILLDKVLNNMYLEGNIEEYNRLNHYEDFISLSTKHLQRLTDEELLRLIPKTEHNLNLNAKEGKFSVVSFSMSEKSATKISTLSVFIICKCIFRDYELDRITGNFISNIRVFDELDATYTIGDMHSKILFEICHETSFKDFENQINLRMEMIRSGLYIFNYIYSEYPNFKGAKSEAKARRDNLNIVFNYLGEIKNIEESINEIASVSYGSNYLVGVTNRDKIYIITAGNIFKNNLYYYEDNKILVEKRTLS